ncbi:hypothetical protein ACE7GA_13005 [Roseomonas sp. CCTCC AB2023176]|uniref:hypothetical protein n=1 Tax=Roseomonas sp. CCTCC AB2023176 TaxID=3342640 RepID=UPI0035D5BB86
MKPDSARTPSPARASSGGSGLGLLVPIVLLVGGGAAVFWIARRRMAAATPGEA